MCLPTFDFGFLKRLYPTWGNKVSGCIDGVIWAKHTTSQVCVGYCPRILRLVQAECCVHILFLQLSCCEPLPVQGGSVPVSPSKCGVGISQVLPLLEEGDDWFSWRLSG